MNQRVITIVVVGVLLAVVGGFFFIFTKDITPSVELSNSSHNNSSTAFILPVAEPDYFPLRDFNVEPPLIQARAAALFDTRSGKFLYQKEIDLPLPIASLTKLMTAVVILENLNLNKDIQVTAENLNVDGYGADFIKGERLNGLDLLKIMLIKSSNDAALVFATEADQRGIDLVAKMNAKVLEIGMTVTQFTNTAGLDDSASSTASDLVKLVQYISQHHPLIWDILRTRSLEVTASDGVFRHHIVNTDQLLDKMPNIIGGKTGFTPGARGTMILVVDVNGGLSNLIGVILGSNDRFSEVRQLIEWGRAAYRWR